MSKSILELSGRGAGAAHSNRGATGGLSGDDRRSPLAKLVSEGLRTKGMRQVDFCRQAGFDQGLLSKILSSVVSTLNVESALKLAEGMRIQPSVIFEAIGKKDVDEMLRRFYSTPIAGSAV